MVPHFIIREIVFENLCPPFVENGVPLIVPYV
jgi:hypothetical protein